MSEIQFIDSTARDGVQSLWAMRLTAPEMLAIAPVMDRAGFKAIDWTAGLGYAARFLGENPWERLRLVGEAITRTPLQVWVLSRPLLGSFSSVPKPQALAKLWIATLARYGVRRLIFLEEENDYGNIPDLIRHAHGLGMTAVVCLLYSLSPYHTPAYYVKKTAEAIDSGADIIELKDQGGLLTPETTREFIGAAFEGSKDRKIDFEFQTHCTTGLGLLCTLEAIRLGVRGIRSALPPLCEGSANPNTFSIIRNAAYEGHTTRVDMDALRSISEHFMYIAKREGLPIGAPREYDASQYDHQVPGGVQGTLRWQLAQLRSEHRFDEVLAEVARVRRDLGYPIMVTPTSQFVVAQATMNVLSGERYRNVSNEIMEKVLLPEAIPAPGPVDPELKAKILTMPQAQKLLATERRDVSLDEMRRQVGEDLSDEDFLARLAIPEEFYAPVRNRKIRADYVRGDKPELMLVRELLRKRSSSVYIRKGDFELRLEGGAGAPDSAA